MYNYENKLKEKDIEIIPLGKYVSGKIPILHRCTCGNEWNVRPGNVLSGQKCKTCANNKASNNLKKDNKHYLIQLKNKDIKVIPLENYDGINKKILHRCTCGNEWKLSPHAILKGYKCGCSGGKQRTNEDYTILLKKNNIDILPLENYISNTIKILHKCTCGNEWKVTPKSILKGSRCNACKDNKINLYKNRKTILYYVKVDNYYKIGITLFDGRRSIESNILKKRFGIDIKNGRSINIIKSKLYDDGSNAYITEQKIIYENKKHKYEGENMLVSGNTEMFNKNILIGEKYE